MHLSFYLAYCIYGGGQPPHFFKTFISRFSPTFWMQYYYVSHYHPFLDVPTRSHELIWSLTHFITWNVWCGKRQNPSIFYKNRKIAKMNITFVKSMQITSYLNRSCISVRGTIPEHLAIGRHFMTDDVMFLYFSYNDVICYPKRNISH